MGPISFSVPALTGDMTVVEAKPKSPLFILGRNGTGKSALVHFFVSQIQGDVIYLPGSRPSYFDDEDLNLTAATKRQFEASIKSWDRHPTTRWKSMIGTNRNEMAIDALTDVEIRFQLEAAKEIKRDGKESSAVARLQAGISPLDRTNSLLRQANMPIQLVMDGTRLRASRNGNTYSIAKTSDGERVALVLLAQVASAPSGSIFVIDEPELHMHRAIVAPLMSAIIRQNQESTFIISTHQLDLASNLPDSSVVVLRDCFWNAAGNAQWDLSVMTNTGDIPEDLRTDIFGSRRKILFVEGATKSLDEPLYSILFPEVSVRPRESCREVERAVTGLDATKSLHHVEAFGMVDGDGMSSDQIVEFESKNVYPLPLYSVESLYYSDEMLAAIAKRQAETLGQDANEMLSNAKLQALKTLSLDAVKHLASRVAEREFREVLLSHIPKRDQLMDEMKIDYSIPVPSTYPAEISHLRQLLATNDLAGIVARYPVRESNMLAALARGLRFTGRDDYESAVLTRLSMNDDGLCALLRSKLQGLAFKLA